MKTVDEFCHKYQAQVGKSHRVLRRAQSVPYDVWAKDFDVFKTIECQNVPMVEIIMPEDRLRALLEHDHWIERAGLQDNQHFQNNVMRVSNMVVDHERECRIRQENPAVKLAYEKYQTLLNLVRHDYD